MNTFPLRHLRAIAQQLPAHPIVWRRNQPERVMTIELQTWLPVSLLLLTLLWYLASPAPVALMSVVTFGAMLLFAFLWAHTMARRVRANRALQSFAMQVGDELEELVTLDNRSILPVLWAEFVDRSNLPGYTVNGVSAAGSETTYQWRAHEICSQRGVFVLGPWELRLGDPLGLFLVRQTYLERQEVLVHPSLAALPPHLHPRSGALGDRRPLRRSLPANTNDAFATRPYAPGDPLRYVHWRTTAHYDSPFVKIFEPEAASNIWLVPDVAAESHFGETEETMVTLAASLAAQLLREQLAVGVLLDGEPCQIVLPRRGMPQLWEILRALALVKTWPGRSLAQTLAHANAIAGASDLVIALTPSLGADWVRALKQLAWNRRGSGADAMLLDPASFGAEANIEPLLGLLAELGLSHRVVRREDVRPITGTYGTLSRWEFITTATGGVVVKQAPRRAPTLNEQLNALGSSATRGGNRAWRNRP